MPRAHSSTRKPRGPAGAGAGHAPPIPTAAEPALRRGSSQRWLVLLLLPLLALAVLAVHRPALSASALSFDDTYYLTENYVVQNPSWTAAKRFLTEVLEPSTVGGYYQPLAMISLMLDCAAGGTPDYLRPFHRTSLGLHTATTLLLALLLYELFRRAVPAALTALLFGVHPLTVEPIPWVGERKTVLAAFFAMSCLVLYVRYAQSGRRRWYWASVLLFVPALMSKPTTTMLPIALLLMDFWPLRRLLKEGNFAPIWPAHNEQLSAPPSFEDLFARLTQRLNWPAVREKVPFLALSLISGIITFLSQARTAAVILPGEKTSALQIPLRLAHNIVFYLWKIVHPVNLSSHYPVPNPVSLGQPMILIGVIGTLVLFAVLVLSLRWTPALLTGWLIFFMMQLPTMQIVGFSNVIASDKFVYLPSFGLLIVIAWGVGELWGRDRTAVRWRAAAIVAVFLSLASLEARGTRRYLALWQDTEKLHRHMISLAPKAPSLHYAFGTFLGTQRRYAEARVEFEEGLRLAPEDPKTLTNLGATLMELGEYEAARERLQRALHVQPASHAVLNNLGLLEQHLGDAAAANKAFQEAARLRPDAPRPRYNLGRALLRAGRVNEAITQLRDAVRLKPGYAEAHCALGDALAAVSQHKEAMQEYITALRLKPQYPEALSGMSSVLLQLGRNEEALTRATEAVRLQPDYAAAHYQRGLCLSALGRIDEKAAEFQRAVDLDPKLAEAHNNLGAALVGRGELGEARYHFAQAVRLKPDYLDAHFNFALVSEALGDTAAAMQQYREVLRLDPANQHARQRLQPAAPSSQP